MKATDVTDEINEAVCEAVGHYGWDGVNQKEIIAAAINAVLGDPTPITVQSLLDSGYAWRRGFLALSTDRTPVLLAAQPSSRDSNSLVSQFSIWEDGSFDCDFIYSKAETIGQLRALEIGLGITQ